MPKLLIVDIETSPNLAYTWGIWNQNINLDQLINASEMISWAAKWYGKKEIYFKSVYHDTKKKMLNEIKKLLNEAEVVIHFNGRSFDLPIIRTDLLLNHITPPSPVKQIDLMETAKRTFRFQSNKLEFICRELGIGKKESHEGFNLWKKCLANDAEAWETMRKYNIKDILLTEKLYDKLKPWIENHPYLYGGVACPRCGSEHTQRRGYQVAIKHRWARHQCMDCGGWFKGEQLK